MSGEARADGDLEVDAPRIAADNRHGARSPNPLWALNIGMALFFVLAAIMIAGCGQKEAPAAAAQSPVPGSTAGAPAAAPGAGEAVFRKTCRACHEQGIAGAPRLGDAADWAPRIAQGTDSLYQHSLEGFTGTKGVMPPKGGFTTLSDAEVTAAVDYMVGQAQ